MDSRKHNLRDFVLLALITLAGLALRLAAWRWREFQSLGGDEQEYFDQALTLLRDHRYVELRLMRPPLYTLFLAASILAVDSLVQNLRLVQALVSAATVPLVFMLTHEVAIWGGSRSPRRVALLAAALCALCYTLAANATELLTETLFLFGLTAALWLLLRAARRGSWPLAATAGLVAGALCLVRSVGLPLVALGAVWLFLGARRQAPGAGGEARCVGNNVLPAVAFLLAALLLVAPWTARNYATYGGLIVIDTTGAENLWLDNDPAGREVVKAQLYALGEDRLLRQQLASRRGVEVILAEPGRFAAKAWGELLKLFALEQTDDLLARPAIWVSPAELWARLILGDALWLVILLAGSYGLAQSLLLPKRLDLTPTKDEGRRTKFYSRPRLSSFVSGLRSTFSPAWLLAPWALYVGLTTLVFHVELRYRLPLYPALLPYAALVLSGGARREARGAGPIARVGPVVAAMVPLALLGLTLLHAPYPALSWRLGWKHWHLARAEAHLERGARAEARGAAEAALALDDGSALARVALARTASAGGDLEGALVELDAAVDAVPDHPQAHVLRGDMRRALGDLAGARADLAFETASRQDLQRWLWERAATPAAPRLDLGGGLDLGFVGGAHAVRAGEEGYRWTTGRAALRLASPARARELALRLASGRPEGSPPVPVEVWAGGELLGTVRAPPGWAEVALPLPAAVAGSELVVELRAPTFMPRQLDRASPDGRQLGVKVDWAELR